MKIGDFESRMSELESIVSKLEEGNLSLEESLKLFERGVKISADGMKLLDESEARIQKLSVLGGGTAFEARGAGDFEDDKNEI